MGLGRHEITSPEPEPWGGTIICASTIVEQEVDPACASIPEPSPQDRPKLLVIVEIFVTLALFFQHIQELFGLKHLGRLDHGDIAIKQEAVPACTVPSSFQNRRLKQLSQLKTVESKQSPLRRSPRNYGVGAVQQEAVLASHSPLRRSRRSLTKRTYSIAGRCDSTGCKDDCSKNECVNRRTRVECDHDNCGRSWCQNRLFTRPPKRKLTVFKTYTRRGRGLRTDEDLPQDIFVGEIKGVVRDMRDSDGDWSSSHFRMALSNGRELDATHVNSQARYVNHTCGEPNCGWEEWEGADGKVHVAVFTVMPVKADTELTIRYHDCTQAGMEEPKAPPQQSKKGEACLCGSDNCCGLLWGPELEGP